MIVALVFVFSACTKDYEDYENYEDSSTEQVTGDDTDDGNSDDTGDVNGNDTGDGEGVSAGCGTGNGPRDGSGSGNGPRDGSGNGSGGNGEGGGSGNGFGNDNDRGNGFGPRDGSGTATGCGTGEGQSGGGGKDLDKHAFWQPFKGAMDRITGNGTTIVGAVPTKYGDDVPEELATAIYYNAWGLNASCDGRAGFLGDYAWTFEDKNKAQYGAAIAEYLENLLKAIDKYMPEYTATLMNEAIFNRLAADGIVVNFP